MHCAATILLAAAAWPLWLGWRATTRTTLRSTLTWTVASWAVWLVAFATREDLAVYIASSLSGCAGVAVLGARRPGVGAWNFVVAGLFTVFLLPVAQAWGSLRIETAQVIFLGVVLAVPMLNYLPTRLAPAALAFGLGCASELVRLSALFPAFGVTPRTCAWPPRRGSGWRHGVAVRGRRDSISSGFDFGTATASFGDSARGSKSTRPPPTRAGRFDSCGMGLKERATG